MTRLLLVAALALAATAGTTLWLEGHRQEERRRLGSLQALAPQVDPEEVAHLAFTLEGRRWQYVRRDGLWRFPDYFDAYALGDRLDFLVSSLLQSRGTPIETTAPQAQYGLDAPQRLPFELADAEGNTLLKVWIGHGVTDPADGEAYLRRPDTPQLYHWHANPRTGLDNQRPPLIDRRVLPAALRQGSMARIEWTGDGAPVRSLRRVQLMSTLPSPNGGPPPGPGFAWVAVFADGAQDTCRGENVYRYLRFVQDLRFRALHPPRAPRGKPLGRMVMIPDEGRRDTLEIGHLEDGKVLISNRASGLVNVVDPRGAQLLFPTQAALLDSLPPVRRQ
jgi:hypothetical protein